METEACNSMLCSGPSEACKVAGVVEVGRGSFQISCGNNERATLASACAQLLELTVGQGAPKWRLSPTHTLPGPPALLPLEAQEAKCRGAGPRLSVRKKTRQSGGPCKRPPPRGQTYTCCCLEIGNAFFTLSGTRAKAIYKWSAGGESGHTVLQLIKQC